MYRYAIITGARSRRELEAYLPDNYRVIHELVETVERRPSGNTLAPVYVIQGKDDRGWTLDAYVKPRLASGLIYAEEIDLSHPTMKLIPQAKRDRTCTCPDYASRHQAQCPMAVASTYDGADYVKESMPIGWPRRIRPGTDN
jgi:hypothetical protein